MRWLVALVLFVPVLAGCVDAGTDRDVEEAPAANSNMWQRGLADFYATPQHVRTANATDRRADLAAPDDPTFQEFDESMRRFMDLYEIPAGQLAVMHNDQLIYTAGYGYANRDGTGSVDEQTMFRFASTIKPITHALIMLQIEEGLYGWTDPVFCIPPAAAPDCRIPIQPHPERPIIDERLGDVTVRHLVDHTGGWGSSMTFLNHPRGIAEMRPVLDIEGAPKMWQVAQYVMGAELLDSPGTERAYCNVCYSLLGLVAEAATGVEMDALMDAYLLRPLELSGDLELSKNLPEDRNPREPFYNDDDMVPSVYDPNETVREPDGGANFDTIFTAGGFAGTTEAIAAIYGAYPELIPSRGTIGGLWQASHERRGHTGSVTGASSLSVWADDKNGDSGTLQYVVVFNDIGPASDDCYVAPGFRLCPRTAIEEELMALSVLKAQERTAR
ncbi:MAG: beta-lactamase family protein [Euryarchaeota archaeon]|nr:beta-lactamase family protein [Euryarchaeota archaeon]